MESPCSRVVRSINIKKNEKIYPLHVQCRIPYRLAIESLDSRDKYFR